MRVLLGKKCVCDIKKRGGEYGSRLYFYHCNGKCLMDSRGYLLMFLFYLKYERNIGRVVHIRTIYI